MQATEGPRLVQVSVPWKWRIGTSGRRVESLGFRLAHSLKAGTDQDKRVSQLRLISTFSAFLPESTGINHVRTQYHIPPNRHTSRVSRSSDCAAAMRFGEATIKIISSQGERKKSDRQENSVLNPCYATAREAPVTDSHQHYRSHDSGSKSETDSKQQQELSF